MNVLYRWIGGRRKTGENPKVNFLDIDGILAPIGSEHPSGEKDLEYDPDFTAIEEKVKGTPEIEIGGKIVQEAKAPNWQEIRQEAALLLTRSHDLRIAVVLLRSLLQTEGLIGLGVGLDLLHGLIDRYWDTLFPRLDPEDNNNPIQRINILMTLSDREAVLVPLLGTTLGNSRAMGPCTLRDIHKATGKLPVSADSDLRPVTPEVIDAIFKDTDPSELQAVRQAVRNCLSRLTGLEDLLAALVGQEQAPPFDDLRRVLAEIESVLDRQTAGHPAPLRPVPEKTPSPPSSPAPTRQAPAATVTSPRAEPMDTIKNRQDVTRVLNQICLYYEKNEPASPVPLLLKRAAGLVEKNFYEIIQDMAPESAAQIQKLIGEAKN